MHELSVTTKLVNTALKSLEENQLTRILSIKVEIGAMNDCEDKWLFKYFEDVTKGTACEGARLIIEHKPFIFKCKACGEEFEFDVKGRGDICCEKCKSQDFTMISGRQFDIVSMEAE